MSIDGSTSPIPTLNDEQANALLSVTSESPATQDLADVVNVIFETGLRAGELRDLRFIDAEIIKGNIDTDIVGGRFSVKGKASTRFVHFGPATLKVLQERQERNPESTFIFGEGKPGTLNRVARQLAGLASSIGVNSLTLRTLRRTFIARMVKAGAPVMVIKDIADCSYRTLAKCLMLHSDVDGGKQ
jgi:integrase